MSCPLFVVALILVASASAALSEELPVLLDPGELRLKVVKTEVRTRIADRVQSVLSARPGGKLVVVTLSGTAPRPCRITLEAREFTVVYREKQTLAGGKEEVVVRIQPSAAVADETEFWSMLPQGATGAVASLPVRKAGPVTLRFAVFLPKSVHTFAVRYPTLATGTATVPEAPEQKG